MWGLARASALASVLGIHGTANSFSFALLVRSLRSSSSWRDASAIERRVVMVGPLERYFVFERGVVAVASWLDAFHRHAFGAVAFFAVLADSGDLFGLPGGHVQAVSGAAVDLLLSVVFVMIMLETKWRETMFHRCVIHNGSEMDFDRASWMMDKGILKQVTESIPDDVGAAEFYHFMACRAGFPPPKPATKEEVLQLIWDIYCSRHENKYGVLFNPDVM